MMVNGLKEFFSIIASSSINFISFINPTSQPLHYEYNS